MLALDPIAEMEAAEPSIATDPVAPPASFTPLRDLTDQLRGDGVDRRYPAAVVEPILTEAATSILDRECRIGTERQI